ncbi:bacillithiol biosynthesis deacetylase BshB1 [Aureispira anguillae]|uniref:Bacillithiol biosynthesis deacetylase BshB1 n=1 Tax=Aureispira anguillae TaxID=2864201 RepID=A0A916DP02_9BACT|nr:bacillithiol biosynthesis deacetylase BshB1 [Aureispira anguillae]BDS10224.1 bacillithiol biosynthesis deacetylase BshB1 [Aureispira anguillae]
MKVDILAIGVHPDDIELSCCGTLLHHIAMGKTVGLLDLTCGELGTRGTAEIRLQEAENASQMIGAVVRGNLEMEDGFFEYTKENMLKIVEIIRLMRPEIVLANAISDRHPDHGRAAKLTADACFYAGLRRIETEWEEEAQEAWRPKAVYHYIQDHNLKPDFVVDISPYMDRKIEIIQAYKSQFYDPNSKEPKTPISGMDFLESIKGKNAMYGRPAGFAYGEGFMVARTIGVNNIFDLV